MLDAFDLDPALVHLNHGSFGAVPRAVTAAQAAVRARAEANPMRFFRVDTPGLKEEARHVAGDFLGVGPDDVALVRNVTQAASVVLSGLAARGRLRNGDVVVTGEQGYESVRRTVGHWCERTGATHVVVPHPVDADDAAVVDGFGRALGAVADRGRRVALVVVDHVTSPTGTVLPVERICALARESGALSVRRRRARPRSAGGAPAPAGSGLLDRHLAQVGLRAEGHQRLVGDPGGAGRDRAAGHQLEPRGAVPAALRHLRHRRLHRLVQPGAAAVAFWREAGG